MRRRKRESEPMVVRRVFPGWSICIPRSFREVFQEDEAYWHAWDASRSVSLTSFLMIDENGPVEREVLATVMPPDRVGVLEELPPGLVGWAKDGPAVQPARARHAISGILATDGRLLVVTITHDDIGWARRVLHSIRSHAVPLSEEAEDPERVPVH
jgi:hypothetical protein